MNRPSLLRGHTGFTLVELIVAMGLLSLVLVLLASMTNSTASSWRFTSGKIEQFRSATNAFEALTRRLSQATLNTYWDYDSQTAPTRYLRQSELRFISGIAQPATGTPLLTGTAYHPTHAIFFQAPLGFVDESPLVNNPNFGGLDNLLNTWGYYVEYNRDIRPSFLDPASPNHIVNTPPIRNRYRLMELMQPSNQMTIYNYTSGYDPNNPTKPRAASYVTNPPLPGLSLSPSITPGPYTGLEWFTDALNAPHPPVHVLAENVIALVLLPKLSTNDDPTGVALAPAYSYDSTVSNPSNPGLDSKNQLPPVVQVTMVAIDEASANRMSPTEVNNLDAELSSLFTKSSNLSIDLKQNTTNTSNLENYLVTHRINYRIFTSDVAIRGAKWSTN